MILIGTGTWTFDGPSLTLTFDTGVVYQGAAQGNSTDFSMVCSNGWTLNFSRKQVSAYPPFSPLVLIRNS